MSSDDILRSCKDDPLAEQFVQVRQLQYKGKDAYVEARMPDLKLVNAWMKDGDRFKLRDELVPVPDIEEFNAARNDCEWHPWEEGKMPRMVARGAGQFRLLSQDTNQDPIGIVQELQQDDVPELAGHKKSHADNGLFRCDFKSCVRAFHKVNALTRHKTTHKRQAIQMQISRLSSRIQTNRPPAHARKEGTRLDVLSRHNPSWIKGFSFRG
ncbi:hypothetical protein B0T10DRAFT_464335 [Thelonectria olida]|uniref:C2H2-type domain-containing protein n=1 Tax=Thelonectria olida TaxID=1576542 RepID=A0A9P8VUK3_9HYPO|nr:hypothetical protein B0T10DRAFT_464335 [Thelonectria olida]